MKFTKHTVMCADDMNTEEKIIKWVNGDQGLFAFLWPIAMGDEFLYGDDELSEWVTQLISADGGSVGAVPRLSLPDLAAIRKSVSPGDLDRVIWAHVRDGIVREQAPEGVRECTCGAWGTSAYLKTHHSH